MSSAFNLLPLAVVIAYIGPGAGLSMMGSLIGVGCVVLLALLGPLLYSFRVVYNMIRRRQRKLLAAHSSRPFDGNGMARFM